MRVMIVTVITPGPLPGGEDVKSLQIRLELRVRGEWDLPFGFQADMMILLSVGLLLILSIT